MQYKIQCRCGHTWYITDTPQSRAGRARRSRGQGHAYDAEVVAPWMEQEPAREAQALEPGETRERSQYQNQTLDDVKVKLLRAAVYSVTVPLASIVPTVLIDAVPWYAPLGLLPIASLAAWAIIDRAGFDPLITAEKLTRVDIDGDGHIGEIGEYRAKGQATIGETTIYTQFELSDPWAWHHFCKTVHAGANFSWRTAKDAGVSEAEYRRVVRLWADPDPRRALIDPASVGERKTIALTKWGRLMVKSFALTPPQAL